MEHLFVLHVPKEFSLLEKVTKHETKKKTDVKNDNNQRKKKPAISRQKSNPVPQESRKSLSAPSTPTGTRRTRNSSANVADLRTALTDISIPERKHSISPLEKKESEDKKENHEKKRRNSMRSASMVFLNPLPLFSEEKFEETNSTESSPSTLVRHSSRITVQSSHNVLNNDQTSNLKIDIGGEIENDDFDEESQEALDMKKRISSARMSSPHAFLDKASAFIRTMKSIDGVKKILLVPEFLLHELEKHFEILSVFDDISKQSAQLTLCTSYPTELMLCHLRELGVGILFGKAFVLPIDVSVRLPETSPLRKHQSVPDKNDNVSFSKSIRERGLLESILDEVYLQSRFSFDYLVLTIIASILAAIGLAVDSDVVVVASMLVSPIMGPILGMCFGYVIQNHDLAIQGLINELISLFICVVVGFICGIPITLSANDIRDNSDSSFPSGNMLDRGEWAVLVLGLAIAIPSGIGVALSVTGDHTTSLVGVAISASLLPPAVNSGLLLSYAMFRDSFGASFGDNDSFSDLILKSQISLLLTLVNVICIFFSAIFMFRIKEISPVSTRSMFWEEVVGKLRKQAKREDESDQQKRREFVQKLAQNQFPKFLSGGGAYDYRNTYLADVAAFSAGKPSRNVSPLSDAANSSKSEDILVNVSENQVPLTDVFPSLRNPSQ